MGRRGLKSLVKVLELLGSKGTKLPAFHIQTVAPHPIQTYLKCCILCHEWYNKAEVGAVILQIKVLTQVRGQLLVANQCLEVTALTPIFHEDVKIALVTEAREGGQHWNRKVKH